MAFSKFSLFLSLLAFAFLLSSYQVHCNENEDAVREGINTYRKNLNLTTLSRNEKASCLAEEISDALENQPCIEFSGKATDVSNLIDDFPKLLKECDIDVNTTTDGAILPVCVSRLIGDIVIGNFTRFPNKRFLKDSKFTGAGVGSDDDWVVIVLTTHKLSGSFSAAAAIPNSSSSAVANKGFVGLVLALASCLLFWFY